METESASQPRFDARVLDRLACPACFGSLGADAAHVVCTACGRAYPVIDGIPVLIAERAEHAGGATVPSKGCVINTLSS